MEIGLIGVGRMGRELARRLKDHVSLTAFDRDAASLAAVQNKLGISTAASISQLATLGTVILAVPDAEVINCVKELNESKVRVRVVNIATNVNQSALEQSAGQQVRCINVKFVAHAGEMALGIDPVIIVNEYPPDLAEMAKRIFAPVGKVVVGQADLVRFINRTAAEKALEAAVNIEESLHQGGVSEPEIVRSAIRHVAAGVLKAYADQDLGPFALDVVRSVRAKIKK
jgi:pyrroline-5-carboxylate reductase